MLQKFLDTCRAYSWLAIVFVFIFLTVAWTLLVRFANENRPETIEIKPQKSSSELSSNP